MTEQSQTNVPQVPEQPQETALQSTEQVPAVVPQGAEDRLARIEALLEKKIAQDEKRARTRTIVAIVFMAAFLVLVVLFVSFYTATMDTMQTVRNLAQNADIDLGEVMQKIQALDIDAINRTIEGVSNIDYGALNTSIQALQKAVEGFQSFIDTLSTPINAVQSLFGN